MALSRSKRHKSGPSPCIYCVPRNLFDTFNSHSSHTYTSTVMTTAGVDLVCYSARDQELLTQHWEMSTTRSQYSTVQHSTAQHSTVQYSTVHHQVPALRLLRPGPLPPLSGRHHLTRDIQGLQESYISRYVSVSNPVCRYTGL